MREQGKTAACRGRLPLFAAAAAVTRDVPRGRWPIPASPRPPLPARLSVPRV